MKRSAFVHFRATHDERDEIHHTAQQLGVTAGDLLRSLVLPALPTVAKMGVLPPLPPALPRKRAERQSEHSHNHGESQERL